MQSPHTHIYTPPTHYDTSAMPLHTSTTHLYRYLPPYLNNTPVPVPPSVPQQHTCTSTTHLYRYLPPYLNNTPVPQQHTCTGTSLHTSTTHLYRYLPPYLNNTPVPVPLKCIKIQHKTKHRTSWAHPRQPLHFTVSQYGTLCHCKKLH